MGYQSITAFGPVNETTTAQNIGAYGPINETFAGAGATAVTLSGPSSGASATPSTNFTVGVDATPIVGTVVVTPATDVGSGGTFSPSTVNLTTGSPIATFTFTPAVSGVTHQISVTNDGGLTDPADVAYDVIPSVALTLVTSPSDSTPRTGLTSLTWAWFDEITLDLLNAPTDQGTTESTDGSGVLFVPLPNTTLATGDVGTLAVSQSDGDPAQSPVPKAFIGPVTVL